MKKTNLKSALMMAVTLVVITLLLQGGCISNGGDCKLSHDDSAKIAKSYNSANDPCKQFVAINKKRTDSMSKFFNRLHPNFYYGDSSYLPWAQRSIEAFRNENRTLILHDGHFLTSYFVPIEDINSLVTQCNSKGKILSGIRLYFGKDVDNGALQNEYTHFIFPTELALANNRDIVDCGFIEQIRPEAGLGSVAQCTLGSEDILCTLQSLNNSKKAGK